MAAPTFEEMKESFLEEQQTELEHSGKKGMKWGHRKAEDPASSIGGKSNNASQDIKDARQRQAVRVAELQGLNKEYNAQRTSAGRAKVEAIIQKKGDTYLNGQDAYTASRQTKGEKVAAGIALGFAAAVIVGSTALQVAANSR